MIRNCNIAISWANIQKYNKNIHVKDTFYRTAQNNMLYRKNLAKEGKNKHKNMLAELFPLNQTWKMDINKFPYNFAPGLLHLLLWFNPNHFIEKKDKLLYDNIKVIESVMKKTLPSIPLNKIVFFKNAPSNRSIPGIPHYHVIIKIDKKIEL